MRKKYRWRRRTIAGLQGKRNHRQDPPLHSGHFADFTAASPRHLLHRGFGPVDFRLEERQPESKNQREAGSRKRCGNHCRRCSQSKGRPDCHFRCRRRNRSFSGFFHAICRHLSGNRAERNSTDTGTKRSAPYKPTDR